MDNGDGIIGGKQNASLAIEERSKQRAKGNAVWFLTLALLTPGPYVFIIVAKSGASSPPNFLQRSRP